MKTTEILTPSGLKLEIRETTGADDDLFSGATARDYDIINQFVSTIIVGGDLGKPSPTKVKKMLLRDKYFTILSSRIFSLSPILYFTHAWEEGQKPEEYAVDLSEYIWDYTKPVPEENDPKYFDQRILPYPENMDKIEFVVGDKKFQMDFLTGEGEAYLLELPPSQRSINQQLSARNLSMEIAGEFKRVKNFGQLSAREMVTIRGKATELDPEVQGLVTISNPYTGEVLDLSILGIVDFFFPTKI